MVKLYMLPAREGDFIWITYGEKKYYHVLIDGGTADCGEAFAAVLKKIFEQGEKVEALILTHIDNDHIMGALNGIAQTNKQILKQVLQNIYFNTRRGILKKHNSIIFSKPDWETQKIIKKPMRGYGVGEAISFMQLLKEKELSDRLKEYIAAGDTLSLTGGSVLKVISPTERALQRLAEKWETHENQYLPIGYSIQEKLSQKNLDNLKKEKLTYDSSINNRASIAILFEYRDVKIPLLADAAPSLCMAGLRRHGINEPYQVNALKLSHHGSRSNTSDKLLNMLPTTNYLLSTNGKQKQTPNKIVISHLLSNREQIDTKPIKIFCNYSWWNIVYHGLFFTKQDKLNYLQKKKLVLQELTEKGIPLEGELSLYGEY